MGIHLRAVSTVGLELELLDVSHTRLGASTVKSLAHRSRHVLRELWIGGLNFETNDTDQPFVPSPLIEPAAVFPNLKRVSASHIRCDPDLVLQLLRACPGLETYSGVYQPLESSTLS